jgi:hypothetical protein
MAESDPPRKRPAGKAAKPAAKATRAQAEFARFKGQQSAAAAAGSGVAFASPLPTAAVPAWSLQPPPPPPPSPPGYGPRPGPPWGPAAAAPFAGSSPSIVEGVGSTIRLGVEVLNAALSSSLVMLTGVGDAVGWGRGTPGYDDCGCGGDQCGYDCCCVMGCGGCCEPSVGTCC